MNQSNDFPWLSLPEEPPKKKKQKRDGEGRCSVSVLISIVCIAIVASMLLTYTLTSSFFRDQYVEELEKKLSMMKFGIPVSSQQNTPKQQNNEIIELEDNEKNVITPSDDKISVYSNWQAVIERIGEIKRSLSSQFNGAKAYKTAENTFIIKMTEFFAKRISSNESDLAIVRGVISEIENVDISEINVKIDGIKLTSGDDISSELEKLMN